MASTLFSSGFAVKALAFFLKFGKSAQVLGNKYQQSIFSAFCDFFIFIVYLKSLYYSCGVKFLFMCRFHRTLRMLTCE